MERTGEELKDKGIEQALAHLEHAEGKLKVAEAAEEAAENVIHEALQEIKEAEAHHQEKTFEIIVNGRQKVVTSKVLAFAEVVALGFDQVPTGPDILFTITYRRGQHEKPEGTLVEGDTVKVKDGMIFNVTTTTKS
jgi:hypothetical protein